MKTSTRTTFWRKNKESYGNQEIPLPHRPGNGQMPDFVKEYQLETRHSLTTSYQYLTEIRRFFSWLIAENLTQAKSSSQVLPSDLEKLSRSDVMLYLDKLEHSKNKQGHLNSPTTVNRSLNALRSLYKYLTITADKNNGEPYFDRNVMLKINFLPYTSTLNYRLMP